MSEQSLVFHPLSFAFIMEKCAECGEMYSWEGWIDAREYQQGIAVCSNCGHERPLGVRKEPGA